MKSSGTKHLTPQDFLDFIERDPEGFMGSGYLWGAGSANLQADMHFGPATLSINNVAEGDCWEPRSRRVGSS